MTGSKRDSLHEAILQLGETAEGEVQLLAMRLSTRFQQSGLTIDQIEAEIRKVRAAKSRGPAGEPTGTTELFRDGGN